MHRCQSIWGLDPIEHVFKIGRFPFGDAEAMAGLMGPSCESLALWLSERAQCLEES